MLGKKIIIHYKQIVNGIYGDIYCNRNNVLDRHLNTKDQLMGKVYAKHLELTLLV